MSTAAQEVEGSTDLRAWRVRIVVAETQGFRRVRLHERVPNLAFFGDPSQRMYVDGGEFEYLVAPDWHGDDAGVRQEIDGLRIGCKVPEYLNDPGAWAPVMVKELARWETGEFDGGTQHRFWYPSGDDVTLTPGPWRESIGEAAALAVCAKYGRSV